MIRFYHDKKSVWTVGRDVAVIDRKDVKLQRPVEKFDGLPYLPHDEFCEATGCSYSVDNDVVDIKTNIF